ncbi:hypothetical protein BCV72DRAFT_38618 [Rhizopus microsporus var. microsporus]|uniref:Uncharacterized protein n=1 Tax=Rhizopus microsporus var. microsporus TaxID=86635 RepID=A0A1X0RDD6_RHIZD|nr:hypothetical protein BCV72DRAFT_38618 [Rhizopus microsporus var. microsporus]
MDKENNSSEVVNNIDVSKNLQTVNSSEKELPSSISNAATATVIANTSNTVNTASPITPIPTVTATATTVTDTNTTTYSTSNTSPVTEYIDQDFLKLTRIYEKRIHQSNTGLNFHRIMSRVQPNEKQDANVPKDLQQSISKLERETDTEIQELLEYKSRQELTVQQVLDNLDKDIQRSEAELKQQYHALIDLENKLKGVNRQYELEDTIDQELQALTGSIKSLAGTFQTADNPFLRISNIVFGQIIFLPSAHFGKSVNVINQLFLEADKPEWKILLDKQMAKCYEKEIGCSEEVIQEFKGLFLKAGLVCQSKPQDDLIRDCITKAYRLRRFAVVRYPGFLDRARAHYEGKMKKPRSIESSKGQSSWVQEGIRKFKKLTENRHSVHE